MLDLVELVKKTNKIIENTLENRRPIGMFRRRQVFGFIQSIVVPMCTGSVFAHQLMYHVLVTHIDTLKNTEVTHRER